MFYRPFDISSISTRVKYQRLNYNVAKKYIDNQKTVEHENDIKAIVNCVQRIYK